MPAQDSPLTPEQQRSREATVRIWEAIEAEFGLLAATDAADLLDPSRPAPGALPGAAAEGQLIAVRWRGELRYPGFQFDAESRRVLEAVPALAGIARENESSSEDLVLWMCCPSSFFPEEDRPVDHIREVPRVLAAAEDHFGGMW